MAVKYISDFNDDDGRVWHIVIHDDEYGGSSPLPFTVGEDGFLLKYEGNDTDRTQVIIPSTVEFTYFIQNGNDNNLLADIAGSDEGRYRLEIYAGGSTYANGNLYWRGVILADISEIIDMYYPQPFRLTAIDDLAGLRNVPYETTDTGYVPISGLIAGFMNKMRVWDLQSSSHRASVVTWNRADIAGTNREAFFYGEMNMVSFTNSEDVPSTYRDTYESLEAVLSGFGCRMYWNASYDVTKDSEFVIDNITAQENTSSASTLTINSSGTIGFGSLSRNTLQLDSTGFKRLEGFRRGYLNPLRSVKRQFKYGGNPFVVDHEYSGVQDSNNFHDGNYNANLDPAPSVEYQEGSRVSLRFTVNLNHADGSSSGDFDSTSAKAGRFLVSARFRIGQYYAKRHLTITGLSNHYIQEDADYCFVPAFVENEATWETTSVNSSIEFFTQPVNYTLEESLSINMGVDLPPLPADLTSEVCTVSFVVKPVNSQGNIEDTADLAQIGALFADTPTEVQTVCMYPTDIFQTQGSQVTFHALNDNDTAREEKRLPSLFWSDKLGTRGGGLYMNVSGTRVQPSNWNNPNDDDAALNLHNLVAQDFLNGQLSTLRKIGGEIRDFRGATSQVLRLSDIIEIDTVDYLITRLDYNAARSIYTVDAVELSLGSSSGIEPSVFSDGFDNPAPDIGRPPTSPSTDTVIDGIVEKTDNITISQAVNLDTLESNVTNITNVLKTTLTGDGAGVYADTNKSTDASHMSLTTSQAKIQAGGGNTLIDITETSPGNISFSVQVGPAQQEVSRTALEIQGTTGGIPNIIFQGNVSGIDISSLSDVTVSGVQNDQVLAWNGSNFVNVDPSGGGGSADTTELELKTIFLEQ